MGSKRIDGAKLIELMNRGLTTGQVLKALGIEDVVVDQTTNTEVTLGSPDAEGRAGEITLTLVYPLYLTEEATR